MNVSPNFLMDDIKCIDNKNVFFIAKKGFQVRFYNVLHSVFTAILSLHYQFRMLETGVVFVDNVLIDLQKKFIMVQNEEQQQFNAAYYNQEKFLDVVTKKKINKHLSDIHDKITEDDIKNVKTDIGITAALANLLKAGIDRLQQHDGNREPLLQPEV